MPPLFRQAIEVRCLQKLGCVIHEPHEVIAMIVTEDHYDVSLRRILRPRLGQTNYQEENGDQAFHAPIISHFGATSKDH